MVASESDKSFEIGEWTLIPALNLLRRRDREVRLEPRHADLLAFLAEHAGEVLSAEEILDRVWSGMVVTDQSVYQAIAKLRKALGDDAGQATYIETVPKRGYRVIAPTREIALAPQQPRFPHLKRITFSAPELPTGIGKPIYWALGIAAALSVALIVNLGLHRQPDPPRVPAHWNLAVLPFTSLSAANADSLLAQGFAIELADQLAHIDEVQVFGPVSAQLAAANTNAARTASERFDADILVTGSLRRAGNQLRIAAALTDGRTDSQVWSKIFDRTDGDTFGIQRSVAAEVAKALKDHLGLDAASAAPAAGSDDRRAYDAFLLGQHYRTIRSAASLKRARDLFRRAIEVDPGFIAAKRDLATTYLLLSFYADLPLREALEFAGPLLKQCLVPTGNDAQVLGAVGLSHALQGAYGLAEDYLRRAVALSPNYVEGWMWLGLAERQQGRLTEALTAFKHARDLEPLMVTAVINYGNALVWSGHPVDARAEVEELTASVHDHPQLYRVLSNILLEAGDLAGADHWAKAALAMDPGDALSRANMAMVLAYLGREDEARAMTADTRPLAYKQGRATQLYLDRMTLSASASQGTNLDDFYDAQLKDSPNLPEIDWRLSNARIGLAAYFSGNLDDAQKRLDRSLSGRVDPIERTDYDLFLCTSLLDVVQRLQSRHTAQRWLSRCDDDLAEAKRAGWNSLALGYISARLTMLKHRQDEATSELDSLVDRGFRNQQLLALDPVFAPLRGQPRFDAIQRRIQREIERARAEIAGATPCPDSETAGCEAPSASQTGNSHREAIRTRKASN